MSRLPGLQFPAPSAGQPLTRGQQRPGQDLLQRLFQLKGDKLGRQGQKFQEDSFNAAKGAYDQSLQSYEKNKAAHDAAEQQKYDTAKGAYDQSLGTFNIAKSQYDTQISDYNKSAKTYADQVKGQQALQPLYRNTYSSSNPEGYKKFWDERGNPYYAKVQVDWRGNARPTGSIFRDGSDEFKAINSGFKTTIADIRPVTASAPAEMPSFNATPPTFDYTTTPFGSDVPSFNYVAPESPGSKHVAKFETLAGLSDQMQQQPTNRPSRGQSRYGPMIF